jgi:alkylhydroperoxidase/carboxymuconolactone decarboxylase family protein
MAGYYHQDDLARFPQIGADAPELWKKFSEWYGAVFAEGALSEREKALIALAVAHAVQCPYCIDAYTQACLEKGLESRADDRGPARNRCDPRRRIPRARPANAQLR